MSLLGRLATKFDRAVRREMDLRQGKILTAIFGMTYKCNLSCRTCGVWRRGETDTEIELTTEEILDTAKQLKELGVSLVVLVGSEPLLRKDAFAVVEGLRALDLEVMIITNGTLVTDQVAARLVKAGVQAVTVSIDAVGERHNEIRNQPKAFERAVAGIGKIQQAKETLGSDRPELALHATISAFNTDVLEEISGLSDELGLSIEFQLASETLLEEVEGSRFDDEVVAGYELVPQEGTFLPDEAGVARIREFLARPGMIQKHPSLSILTHMSDEEIRHGYFPVRTCQVVRGEIIIDPYGYVKPCSHLDGYTYGNVKETPVRDIWRGKQRRRLLDRLRSQLFPVCRKCCQHRSNLTPVQKLAMMVKGMAR